MSPSSGGLPDDKTLSTPDPSRVQLIRRYGPGHFVIGEHDWRTPVLVTPALFAMTRSTSILDLADVGADGRNADVRNADVAILFCPANHSPPTLVSPYPGAPGYEAVATCLAPPDVRARTEGVIAWRPAV